MSSISITGLSKSFGATAVLRSVDLDIEHGEFLTLLGPSGCGKTTLLRIIAGLEFPDSGELRIGGASVLATEAKDRNLAMVFQSYALYQHLTVRQNIALPLRMRRLTRLQRMAARWLPSRDTRRVEAEIETAVQRVAAALQIDHLLERRPPQLSGGQRQRVALGRGMVREPGVFLLDEPLSNLDAQLRIAMRLELAELHRRLGSTFVFVTHDQEEAMTMSDRIAVMAVGRVAQVGTPSELYDDPVSLEVARFVGTPQINSIAAAIDADGMLVIEGQPLCRVDPSRQLADQAVTLAVRPEGLRLGRMGASNSLDATVIAVENLGPESLVNLRLDNGALLVARHFKESGAPPQRNERVTLGLEAGDALLFDAAGQRVRPPAVSGLVLAYA
ncbi:MAG: ABC transporter ATP-binding protein [Rhodoferax sp.]|uniref:ABC transporter ATP-binding protein n=1 Tax=Rhodoferax sp. TaxID=50421 RepID=UPI0026334017|nr:ABC transporter ATP-binding protein [Rhodoferax sp.]MDD5333512.1 ABC transporter ATP-binding protein [Rhodoferax sp.]